MKHLEKSGYTGGLSESEILTSLPDTWKDEGYFDEARSYEWVKKNQPWNPTDPSNKIANDLHFLVAQQLDLENLNDLKFYTALHSPLDIHHGVDAFFEIGDTRFTLDFSLKHKIDHKADYLVNEDMTTEVGREALSKIVAQYLKRNLSQSRLQAA